MRLVAWLLLLPATLLTIAFAVGNRHEVLLNLDPLPLGFRLPLYALALGFVLLGILVGGFSAWVKALRWRRRAVEARREAARLEGEAAALRRQLAEAPPPAAAPPATIEHAA
jgi:uncharacterized integral membrane protein